MFVNMNFRKKFTTFFYRNQKALEKKNTHFNSQNNKKCVFVSPIQNIHPAWRKNFPKRYFENIIFSLVQTSILHLISLFKFVCVFYFTPVKSFAFSSGFFFRKE